MSETIKITEVFASGQGEGKRIGKPSIFVRVFSCNLRCRGFGMPAGQLSDEAIKLADCLDQYEKLTDFPLLRTGCDSYLASYPQFKQFSPALDFEQLAERILSTVPDQNVEYYDLVLTGGEPLIAGTQKKLVKFLKYFEQHLSKMSSLTFETNGTQRLTEEMKDYLTNECPIPVIFSVSPKLACSGEPNEKTHVPQAIADYNELCQANPSKFDMYLKYVVGCEDDIEEVRQSHQQLNFNDVDRIWLMPCGGCYEEYTSIMTGIADLTLKYRYRYSPREHVILYRNQWSK